MLYEYLFGKGHFVTAPIAYNLMYHFFFFFRFGKRLFVKSIFVSFRKASNLKTIKKDKDKFVVKLKDGEVKTN
jgi:hypothetical protein